MLKGDGGLVMGVGIEYMLKHYHPQNPPVMPSFDSA